MEQHSGDLGEYERLLTQIWKNHDDLKDSTLAADHITHILLQIGTKTVDKEGRKNLEEQLF